MDDKNALVADYFVVAGLPDKPSPVGEDYCDGLAPNHQNMVPITDITVIFPGMGEVVPKGFVCVETTPTGIEVVIFSSQICCQGCHLYC